MFQFRPFPPYAYLIQRTVTRYCRVGFPHSEICGYNGYLLLPAAYRSLSRPSSAPDAKAFPLRSFQLDLLVAKSARLRFRRQPPALAENCARSLAPRFPRTIASRLRSDEDASTVLRTLQRLSHKRFLVLLRIMQAIQRKFSFTKSLPFTFRCCSTIKTKTFCCLAFAFFSLFSFQGAVSGLF